MVVSSLAIEITNIAVLCCNDNPLDIVGNFVSLVIVAEFDFFIYQAMMSETYKVLLNIEAFKEQAFTIQHTTSKKCKNDEFGANN